jgi:hypothetical protein
MIRSLEWPISLSDFSLLMAWYANMVSYFAEVFVCGQYENWTLNMYSTFSSTYYTTIFLKCI